MRSSNARLQFNAALARADHRTAQRALLQFAVLATILVSIVFGMAASYERQHAREPIPHVTHGGKVHALAERR